MCRSIKTLHNFAPAATDDEIRASSLQFVRKLSGFTRPAKANQVAFSRAVDQVAQAAYELVRDQYNWTEIARQTLRVMQRVVAERGQVDW